MFLFTILILSECTMERLEQDTRPGSVEVTRVRVSVSGEGESG